MILHKTIATAGKFDWLTDLDVKFLNYVSELGDDLVVILYNDRRVDMGVTNRGNRVNARIKQIEALDCVDSVLVTNHGADFRYAPFTDIEPDDLSVGYEIEQLRPHLFVTHQQKVWVHNEKACEELKVPMRFVTMEEYFPDE